MGLTELKPFFTYFGGKYRIAPRYPRPRWRVLVEPFAGSAGYAVRYPHHSVMLYDANPKVCGTWQYLIRVSAEEILRLPLTFEDVRDLKICQEAKWLIGWWLNKGTAQPRNLPGLWMRQNTRPHSYWGETVRGRLARQVAYIRHWRVYSSGYDSCPNPVASWFVDPPYQRSGKNYPHHEVDYGSLKNWVTTRKGQVIVCGQEGDAWMPFSPFTETRGTQGRKMPGTSKEVIWTNA